MAQVLVLEELPIYFFICAALKRLTETFKLLAMMQINQDSNLSNQMSHEAFELKCHDQSS